MRIGFLFNHYEPHQIAHSAPIAFALSQRAAASQVVILVVSLALMREVLRIAALYPQHRCDIRQLRLPLRLRLVAAIAALWKPRRKQLILKYSTPVFAGLDILVVPERTSLKLKENPRLRHLRLVRIRHGAGDRATGLDASNRLFDLILASGQKTVDRLQAEGVDPANCRIVGYPKFDLVRDAPSPQRLFGNSKPIVLYNPHFKPGETSWYRFGPAVLAFFKDNADYNLIVAPHIMLRRQPEFDPAALAPYRHCSNIHIDLGSEASIDMTYTRMADIYLGDVSSQIYEFLLTPRPCVFLDAHASPWRGNPAFAHWVCGPVIDDAVQLPQALAEAAAPRYADAQRDLFAYTFDLTDRPSAERAADALLQFANTKGL